MGVGDSQGDLSFLVKCGQIACPNNAINEIKSLAFFVANTSTTFGLVEIYQHILTNQSITPPPLSTNPAQSATLAPSLISVSLA